MTWLPEKFDPRTRLYRVGNQQAINLDAIEMIADNGSSAEITLRSGAKVRIQYYEREAFYRALSPQETSEAIENPSPGAQLLHSDPSGPED